MYQLIPKTPTYMQPYTYRHGHGSPTFSTPPHTGGLSTILQRIDDIRIIAVIEMSNVSRGNKLAEVHVACPRIDGVSRKILLQSLGSGLRKEVQNGLPLFDEGDGIFPVSKLLHHPGRVECSEKTTGTTRTSWPKWLQTKRIMKSQTR